MHYLIFSEDHADKHHVRLDTRSDHIDWLKRENKYVHLSSAGPWMDDAGVMKGSLIIVRARSKGEVLRWLEDDPYVKAGLPRQVTVKAFNWAIGAPSGEAG